MATVPSSTLRGRRRRDSVQSHTCKRPWSHASDAVGVVKSDVHYLSRGFPRGRRRFPRLRYVTVVARAYTALAPGLTVETRSRVFPVDSLRCEGPVAESGYPATGRSSLSGVVHPPPCCGSATSGGDLLDPPRAWSGGRPRGGRS